MVVDGKLFFIFLQLCLLSVNQVNANYFSKIAATLWSDTEFVDPHSFYYDKHTKTEVRQDDTELSNSELAEYKSSAEAAQKIKDLFDSKIQKLMDISDEKMMQRLINILLSRGNMQKDGSVFRGHITLEATETEYELLKEFNLGKVSHRQIDPILNNIIKSHNTATFLSLLYRLFIVINDSIMYISENHLHIVLPVIAALFLMWFLRNVRFTFGMIIIYSLGMIFVVSFFITWWNLVQEERIKHTVKQYKHMKIPAYCQGNEASWGDTFASFFRGNDCHQYYEAVMKNPILEITPVQALSHMLAKFVLEPFLVLSKYLGSFLTHFTENMSWFSRFFVNVSALPIFMITIVSLILLYIGGSLHIGSRYFPLLTLTGPTNSTRQNPSLDSKIDRNPIQVMSKENIEQITQESETNKSVKSKRKHKRMLGFITLNKNGSEKEKTTKKEEEVACLESNTDCKTKNTSRPIADALKISSQSDTQE